LQRIRQLAPGKRFGQETRELQTERFIEAGLAGETGDGDDFQPGRDRLEPSGAFQTGHAGQTEVH
jgi:hypothetical protein